MPARRHSWCMRRNLHQAPGAAQLDRPYAARAGDECALALEGQAGFGRLEIPNPQRLKQRFAPRRSARRARRDQPHEIVLSRVTCRSAREAISAAPDPTPPEPDSRSRPDLTARRRHRSRRLDVARFGKRTSCTGRREPQPARAGARDRPRRGRPCGSPVVKGRMGGSMPPPARFSYFGGLVSSLR